jgi:acetyl esterase
MKAHGEELGGDGRIAVAGDSAGGNLAAVVAQGARGQGGPCLQLLVYPAVDRATSYRSMELFAEGFMLSRADVDWFDARYTDDHPELHDDLRISPGLAPDLHDVAPALVYTAGFDPLRDEGERYAERLAHAGRLVEQRRFPDLVHGFVQMGAVSRSCDAALATITRALARALRTGDRS